MGSGSSASVGNSGKAGKDKGRGTTDKQRNEDVTLSDFDSEQSDDDDDYDSDETSSNERNKDRGRHKLNPAEEKREKILRQLKSVANRMVRHPPDKIPLSQSYQTSYTGFQKLLRSPNREVLKKIFEKELWALRQHTAGEIINVEQNKSNTTRDALLSEFKLKVCALVHCYKEMKDKVDEEQLRKDREKLEDMKFLSSLHDRVANGDMPRSLLVLHMDRYGNEHRAKQSQLNANNSEDDRSTISRLHGDRDSSVTGSRRGGYRSTSSIEMNMMDDYKVKRSSKRLDRLDDLD